MTRFARAKGSKASNERVPEEATSWAEMKAQLALKNKEIEDAKKREEFMNRRSANYKAFLDEKALENNKSEWSVFPSANQNKQNVNNSVLSVPRKKNKTSPNKFTENNQASSDDEVFRDLKYKVDRVLDDMEPEENKDCAEPNVLENLSKVKNMKYERLKTVVTKVQDSPNELKTEDIRLKKKSVKNFSEKNRISTKKIKHNFNKVHKDTKIKNNSDSDAPPDEESAKKEILAPTVKVKKIKKKKLQILVDENVMKNEVDVNEQDDLPDKLEADVNSKQQKKTKIKRKIDDGGSFKKKVKVDQTVHEKKTSEDGKIKKKITKSINSSDRSVKKLKKNLTEQDLKKIEKKKQKRIKQLEKKKKLKEELKREKLAAEQNMDGQVSSLSSENMSENTSGREVINYSNFDSGNLKARKFNNTSENMSENTSGREVINYSNFDSGNLKARKFNNTDKQVPKIRDKEEHKRKKPYLPHKMFINGKELEIDYVEGFPVKKEDAVRLKKLRKEMITKGLPGSEIKFALKLERRRAEKAFTREKKKVCYNCRKSGHNLSECPEIGKDELAQTQGSGICFKCGSTEHTHFECKVVRGQEFKYAQCFICNEPGHIARQCPDNARGLYPKGGSCNVCGDVTHLKKDCPKYQAQQLGNSVHVETFGASNPDILDEKSTSTNFQVNKKQNKIIKF